MSSKPITVAQLLALVRVELPPPALGELLVLLWMTVLVVVLPKPNTLTVFTKRCVAGLPKTQPSNSTSQPKGKSQSGGAAKKAAIVDNVLSLKIELVEIHDTLTYTV